MNTVKGASALYHSMLEPETTHKGYDKWENIVQIDKEHWHDSFPFLKSTTKDTKLRWFQLRVLHQTLTTNKSVSYFKRDQNPLCEFCRSHNETIHHLLWKCTKVNKFWENLFKAINDKCHHSHNLRIDEKLILFGKCELAKTDSVSDLIILIGKFYIYRNKVKK